MEVVSPFYRPGTRAGRDQGSCPKLPERQSQDPNLVLFALAACAFTPPSTSLFLQVLRFGARVLVSPGSLLKTLVPLRPNPGTCRQSLGAGAGICPWKKLPRLSQGRWSGTRAMRSALAPPRDRVPLPPEPTPWVLKPAGLPSDRGVSDLPNVCRVGTFHLPSSRMRAAAVPRIAFTAGHRHPC